MIIQVILMLWAPPVRMTSLETAIPLEGDVSTPPHESRDSHIEQGREM